MTLADKWLYSFTPHYRASKEFDYINFARLETRKSEKENPLIKKYYNPLSLSENYRFMDNSTLTIHQQEMQSPSYKFNLKTKILLPNDEAKNKGETMKNYSNDEKQTAKYTKPVHEIIDLIMEYITKNNIANNNDVLSILSTVAGRIIISNVDAVLNDIGIIEAKEFINIFYQTTDRGFETIFLRHIEKTGDKNEN